MTFTQIGIGGIITLIIFWICIRGPFNKGYYDPLDEFNPLSVSFSLFGWLEGLKEGDEVGIMVGELNPLIYEDPYILERIESALKERVKFKIVLDPLIAVGNEFKELFQSAPVETMNKFLSLYTRYPEQMVLYMQNRAKWERAINIQSGYFGKKRSFIADGHNPMQLFGANVFPANPPATGKIKDKFDRIIRRSCTRITDLDDLRTYLIPESELSLIGQTLGEKFDGWFNQINKKLDTLAALRNKLLEQATELASQGE